MALPGEWAKPRGDWEMDTNHAKLLACPRCTTTMKKGILCKFVDVRMKSVYLALNDKIIHNGVRFILRFIVSRTLKPPQQSCTNRISTRKQSECCWTNSMRPSATSPTNTSFVTHLHFGSFIPFTENEPHFVERIVTWYIHICAGTCTCLDLTTAAALLLLPPLPVNSQRPWHIPPMT